MYKQNAIIFSDLDGTLLADDHCPSPETIAGIQSLYEEGYYLVPITARSTNDILNLAKKLKIDQHGGIIAGNNGAQIFDFKTQSWIRRDYIPSEVVEKIFRDNYGHHKAKVNFFGDDTVYVFNKGDNSYYWAEVANMKYVIANSPEKIISPIAHLTIVLKKGTSLEDSRAFVTKLYKDFDGKATIHQYTDRVIEIMPLNVNKGHAAKMIMNHLAVESKKTKSYAFGDGYNDLSLLTAVDVGVAMQNATLELLDIADDVTEFNNDKNGVWHYIETKILKKKEI
ncbi:hypothetical protein JN01_0420 [Entomoplasma freundtii]|uniref:HAD superfamily hydrolase n=1 Tax=Entomoplasma freundtii TaxID=74700 RepID=A0A2K8NQS0_9MOLU|nr:HAD family hydrolase [Entomoplasma freundtii]ATZ16180.1 HAD superfamily hydrolase [Entomoplasma freundtii]TDY56919.1 hypothetical protein JN01_0420 [Entomoplasma freundtii]